MAANCPVLGDPMKCDMDRHVSLFAGPSFTAQVDSMSERQVCQNRRTSCNGTCGLWESGDFIAYQWWTLTNSRPTGWGTLKTNPLKCLQ